MLNHQVMDCAAQHFSLFCAAYFTHLPFFFFFFFFFFFACAERRAVVRDSVVAAHRDALLLLPVTNIPPRRLAAPAISCLLTPFVAGLLIAYLAVRAWMTYFLAGGRAFVHRWRLQQHSVATGAYYCQKSPATDRSLHGGDTYRTTLLLPPQRMTDKRW